jgi:hypothetical protein
VIRLRDFFEAIGDRVVVDGGHLARRLGSVLSWPFRRVAWGLQNRVIWPIQDWHLGRVLVASCAVAVVTAAGVAGLLSISSDGSAVPTEATVSAGTAPLAKVAPPLSKTETPPTLQGATPVFEPRQKGEDAVTKRAAQKEAPAAAESSGASSSSAATDKISSQPAAKASTSSSAPPSPAGPEAIAVAQKFADAFVVYETGGVEANVRETFGETATRELSRALLRRPPRLPANVDVPEAKVVNVVAAPSPGPVYPVSVSLLRLGVTSELRLSMEQADKEWRVSDVLG